MSPRDAAGALSLSADEATAVAQAAAAFAAALPPGRDQPYRALATVAQTGTVPAEQVEALERVCTLALETGKARQIGRAEAERLLSGVLRRTPRGRAMAEEVADVNRALSELAGRQLDAARLTWRLPGHYDLSLSVAGFALTLAIGPGGVRVRSLHTG
jgi:hypothetical protein